MASQVISTGWASINTAIGTGGYPRGGIIEIYGSDVLGPITLAMHAIAEIQKSHGGAAAFVADHALDVRYAQDCGVRVGDLVIGYSDATTRALEIAHQIVRTGAIDLVVVAALGAFLGPSRRAVGATIRRIKDDLRWRGTTVIVVSDQPESRTSVKFHAGLCLDVRCYARALEGGGVTRSYFSAEVIKNKFARPLSKGRFDVAEGARCAHPR